MGTHQLRLLTLGWNLCQFQRISSNKEEKTHPNPPKNSCFGSTKQSCSKCLRHARHMVFPVTQGVPSLPLGGSKGRRGVLAWRKKPQALARKQPCRIGGNTQISAGFVNVTAAKTLGDTQTSTAIRTHKGASHEGEEKRKILLWNQTPFSDALIKGLALFSLNPC